MKTLYITIFGLGILCVGAFVGWYSHAYYGDAGRRVANCEMHENDLQDVGAIDVRVTPRFTEARRILNEIMIEERKFKTVLVDGEFKRINMETGEEYKPQQPKYPVGDWGLPWRTLPRHVETTFPK